MDHVEAPLLSIARRYAQAQQNLETAADSVVVFVTDAVEKGDEAELAIGFMDGRIVEIAIADSLIAYFATDINASTALATYINTFLRRAMEAYAERIGEHIEDGVVFNSGA